MRFYISLFLFLSFISSNAQITVDRSDFGVIGDTILLTRTINGLDSLSVGAAGAAQVWDFSALEIDSFPDTLYFLDTTGFQQVNTLNNVNLVLKDGASLQFIEESSNGIYIQALSLDFDTFFTNVLIEPNPKLTLFDFPLNFGQTSNLSYSANSITLPIGDTLTLNGLTFYVDSARITPTLQKNDNVDAYGTLILPDSNQYDVLRQKSVLTISFSLEVLIPNPFPFPPPFIWFPIPSGVFPPFVTTNYNFLGKNEKYPLLTLVVDSNEVVISARYQLDTSSTVNISKTISNNSGTTIFPNPATNELFIEGFEKDFNFRISDLQGRIEISGIVLKNDKRISIENLKPGIYILEIIDRQTDRIMHFRILKN